MKFCKNLAIIVMFFVSTITYSAMAQADECDWCVCKSKDTANSCTKCCSSAQNFGKASTEVELKISKDGKAIVDQNGHEIARFVEGIRIKTPATKAQSMSLQGCMRCWNECLIYEGERCVKSIRTCEWDFDCNASLSTQSKSLNTQSSKDKVEKSSDTPKIIDRELTPNTGEYMKTPCYKTERYCTEWLPDGKCKLWDSREVQVPC